MQFQSHAGSIEARKPSVEAGNEDSFNPTLVRLRPFIRKEPPVTYLSFNPTLVRLRPYREDASRIHPSLFQSHAGSIEAAMWRRLCIIFTVVSIPRWFD